MANSDLAYHDPEQANAYGPGLSQDEGLARRAKMRRGFDKAMTDDDRGVQPDDQNPYAP